MKSRRRAPGNDEDPREHLQNLGYEIRIHQKTMKWEFAIFCIFQVRESPGPLDVPTPTPAPHRGGPVD